MNRQEHLQWSKDRAIQILNEGDVAGSYSSFMCDMNDHPELANHLALEMGMMLLFGGQLSTYSEMKNFIEGFN